MANLRRNLDERFEEGRIQELQELQELQDELWTTWGKSSGETVER
jgi:hypothetical protein